MDSGKIPHSLAVIPARGGSKGLPRKNVRLLGGIPIIAYTIRAALDSRIERVIVSTDDEEIAQISRSWGAEIPFKRPPEISGDASSSLSVLLHALEFLEQQDKSTLDPVVYLQPTSPFRTSQHINEALDIYFSTSQTSVISVTSVQEFHPFFMFTLEANHTLNPLFKMENRPLRRQDLPPIYRINGAIYISRRSYYRDLPAAAAVFDWNSLAAYVMDAPSSIDINDYLDYQKAQLMLQPETEKTL